jgi:hypothetical protein
MEAKLKAQLWVAAALRMADMAGKPGAVLRRGDPDAGAVLAVLRGRGHLVVLVQTRDSQGRLAWGRPLGVAPVLQSVVDEYVARQVQIDPDLWVVEFESPDYQPPFEARQI